MDNPETAVARAPDCNFHSGIRTLENVFNFHVLSFPQNWRKCNIPLSFMGWSVCFSLSKSSCSAYLSAQPCHRLQHLPPVGICFPRSSWEQSLIPAGADSAHAESWDGCQACRLLTLPAPLVHWAPQLRRVHAGAVRSASHQPCHIVFWAGLLVSKASPSLPWIETSQFCLLTPRWACLKVSWSKFLCFRSQPSN